MKQVAGPLRLDLAQYRELAAFSQFGSDLDASTKARLTRGERIVEILKQGQYVPMNVTDQVISLYTAVNGFLDDISTDKIKVFEEKFLNFIKTSAYKESVYEALVAKKAYNDEIETELKKAIEEFKGTFSA